MRPGVLDFAVGLGGVLSPSWQEPEVRVAVACRPDKHVEVQVSAMLGMRALGAPTDAGEAAQSYIWAAPIERVAHGAELTVGVWPLAFAHAEWTGGAGLRVGGVALVHDHAYLWLDAVEAQPADVPLQAGWTVAAVGEVAKERVGGRVRLGTAYYVNERGYVETVLQPGVEGFVRW